MREPKLVSLLEAKSSKSRTEEKQGKSFETEVARKISDKVLEVEKESDIV